jgi:hypothetical protein
VTAETRLTQAGAVGGYQWLDRTDLGRHLFAAREGKEIVQEGARLSGSWAARGRHWRGRAGGNRGAAKDKHLGGNSLARTVPQTPNDAATSARRVYAMAASGLISTA